MRHTWWKTISHLLGLLSITVLFGLLVFAANVEIKDLDLWLHLKMGEFILQYGYVPDTDVLSCTIFGKPWVNHEWLFQVIAYFVFHNWGAEGLISMQAFVVAFTFLILLFLGYNKEKQFGVTFLLLLIMLVYQVRFTIRPDIFSLLFFALYIYILSLHLDKKWSIYVLFFIQVLWANMHGFFFFGPFIVLVGIVSEFLKRRVKLPWQWNQAGRLSDEEYGWLRKIFFVVVLACLFNPLTFRGAWYPISVLMHIPGESRIFFDIIVELRPSMTWGTIFSLDSYIHYKILILISAFSFIFNRKKVDIGDLFVWGIFLFISVVAVRNIVFFAFVAYLVSMSNFSNISAQDVIPFYFKNKKFLYITLSFLKVMLIVWMIQFATALSWEGYFDFDKFELKSAFGGITQRNYPDKAADFLVENNIRGNFFNAFNTGAYLIGRCSPNVKVFMDGRTEVYGADFFRYYDKIWSKADTETFDEAVKKYNLTGVLFDTVNDTGPVKLLEHIYKDKNWVLIYFNYDALIFLRDIQENKPMINKFRVDLSKWKAPRMDLNRLGPRQVIPYQYISRAFSLEALGFDDQALSEIGEVLKVLPNHAGAYKLMGKIYGKRKDYQKAFENFRIAAMYQTGDSDARANLALAYEKIGDFKGAIKQYNTLIQKNPKSAKWYFLIARTYISDQRYEEAVGSLRQGYLLDPRAFSDILELADLIYQKGRYKEAEQAYAMAVEVQSESAKAHHKLGLCYQKLGQMDLAKGEFDKALKIDPNLEGLKKDIKTWEAETAQHKGK